MSSVDRTSLDASDLKEELLHPNPRASFVQIGETQLLAIRQLATMFQVLLNKPDVSTMVI